MFLKSVCAYAFSMLILAAALPAADDAPVFDIPKLADIKIDGKNDDWGDKGFGVQTLCDLAGKARGADDFNVSFKLGWNEEGLLALVTVVDDVALEPAQKPEDLWQGDSIEFFVATARGSDQCFQVVVAPGRDKGKPELRSNVSDYRKLTGKRDKLSAEAARSLTDKGYMLEVLLPWKNLGIEAKDGAEIAFQLYANDADKENERYQALWYPQPDAHSETRNTHRLRLSDAKTSPPIRAASAGSYDADGKAQITLVAGEAMAGKSVSVKAGDKVLAEAKFEADGKRAVAKIALPKPEKPYGSLGAFSGDDLLCTIAIPEPAK